MLIHAGNSLGVEVYPNLWSIIKKFTEILVEIVVLISLVVVEGSKGWSVVFDMIVGLRDKGYIMESNYCRDRAKEKLDCSENGIGWWIDGELCRVPICCEENILPCMYVEVGLEMSMFSGVEVEGDIVSWLLTVMPGLGIVLPFFVLSTVELIPL